MAGFSLLLSTRHEKRFRFRLGADEEHTRRSIPSHSSTEQHVVSSPIHRGCHRRSCYPTGQRLCRHSGDDDSPELGGDLEEARVEARLAPKDCTSYYSRRMRRLARDFHSVLVRSFLVRHISLAFLLLSLTPITEWPMEDVDLAAIQGRRRRLCQGLAPYRLLEVRYR
jgi:hypothetical protein